MTDITASPMGDTGATAPLSAPVTQGSTENQTTWYSGMDTETVGWLENRGLTRLDSTAALPEVIKGFRNAEKFIGAPPESVLKIPKADSSPEAWNEVYSKLGRPLNAKEYDIQVPEGVPPDFTDWAKGQFHELGLTKSQGEKLASKWQQYVTGQIEGSKASYQNRIAEDTNQLKHEWGSAYDQEIGVARRAAQEFGLETQTIDALEGAMGFSKLMRFMNQIGHKLGEDKFVEGGGSNSFNGALTPNAALAKLKSLEQDKEFIQRYFAGNVEARAEMDRLHKMAYASS